MNTSGYAISSKSVSIVDNSDFVASNNFTMSFWVMPRFESVSHLWILGNAVNDGCVIDAYVQDCYIRLTFPNIINWQGVEIQLNEWAHVVVTRNNNHWIQWVNKVIARDGDMTPNPPTGGMAFNNDVSAPDWNNGWYFDEAAFWDRTLTSDEVADLYNDGAGLYVNPNAVFPTSLTSMQTNLLAVWHFDEGAGDVCADNYGGHDMTLASSSPGVFVPGKDFGIDLSLVAFYPFSGNTVDATGNGHNGSVIGAIPTTDRFGHSDSAYWFDGVDDYIRIPDSPDLILSEDMTINAWIYSDGCSSPCDPPGYHTIINKRDDQVEDSYWNWNLSVSYISGPGGDEFSKLISGRRNPPGTSDYKLSNDAVDINSWQMVSVVIRNDSVMFFINGENAGLSSGSTPEFTIPSVNQAVDILVGLNRKIGDKEQFKGAIDDIRIYNRALSQTEIDGLYHENGYPAGGLVNGVVFNDINGNNIRDIGDTLLADWKIYLRDSTNNIIDSTSTNVTTGYGFYELSDGEYILDEAQQENWIQIYPAGVGNHVVTISNGNHVTERNFGHAYGYRYTGGSAGAWSDSASWTGGVPPRAENAAIIPPGATVTVDSLPSDTIKALRVVDGGILNFSSAVGQLKIGNRVEIDAGAAVNFTSASDTTGMICYKDFVNRGNIDPGNSVITFAGDGPKTIASEGTENEFYKLEIKGDSTSSIGNISVIDKLVLQKPLIPRDQDTIIIQSVDTSAIQDTGKIPSGTIKRAIDPYETGIYRFESPDTYLKFSGDGTNPCAVSMTVLSNRLSGDLYWDSLGGRVDTVKNTIVADSATEFSKWRMGIPKVTTFPPLSDGRYVRIDPIPRTYIIKPECSNNFLAELSLRYNQSDIADIVQKTGWTLSGTPAESDLLLFRGPFAADSVLALWNMVSLPLIPDSADKDYLFPTSISDAFAYEGTYTERTDLSFGEGYWLKFPNAEEVIIEGEDRDSMAIDVYEGWNLIGAISYPVEAESVVTVPPGIIETAFFGYNTAYQPADRLKPLKGYWVKVSSNGSLILKAGEGGAMKKWNIHGSLDRMNVLKVTDAKEKEAVLYFGMDKNVKASRYELPPIPPGSMFDVRYQTGNMVAIGGKGGDDVVHIQITGGEYPVTVSWKKKEPLREANLVIDGKMVEMGEAGEVNVEQDSAQVLLRFGSKISIKVPKEYELLQNYPNPFNPVTVIRYRLPAESRINLKIYNVLGQEVKTLVDEVQTPGERSAVWNSNNTSSGIYFYRLDAVSVSDPGKAFTQVKKMILLK